MRAEFKWKKINTVDFTSRRGIWRRTSSNGYAINKNKGKLVVGSWPPGPHIDQEGWPSKLPVLSGGTAVVGGRTHNSGTVNVWPTLCKRWANWMTARARWEFVETKSAPSLVLQPVKHCYRLGGGGGSSGGRKCNLTPQKTQRKKVQKMQLLKKFPYKSSSCIEKTSGAFGAGMKMS